MEDILPQELKERLTNQENLTLIDVREEWEHQEANIGGENIPMGLVPHRLDDLEQFKDQELIVYCKTGNRSGQVKSFLEDQGYNKVRNLLQGIEGYLSL